MGPLAKTNCMRDRGIVVDRNSSVPLHRQLENAIRDAILSGRLEPGERILSSRELRSHLGLSRNTIVTALGQLHAEGYLTFIRGVGAFVAEALHNRTPRVADADSDVAGSPDVASAFLSVYDLVANLEGCIPFRPGIPALDLFPAAQFNRALSERERPTAVLDYPSPLGDRRLREAISSRLQQTRGVACTADQIVITAGAQAAFTLIAHVLLKRSDTAIVEEPGYPNIRAVFSAHGVRTIGAAVDDAGVDVSTFAKRRAAIVHLTPSHQYPTGAVLSLERRFAVLDWAEKHSAWIIEDDYDSEFTYESKPQPALHGLDGGRRVLYVGTFSKVLAPGLRVGYLVVPAALRTAFEAAQQVMGGHPGAITQRALGRFMESGQFARHIARMRNIYDERRIFASAAITRAFGTSVHVRDSAAGMHFCVEFPKTVDAAAFSARAFQRGVIVPPLSGYFQGTPALNGVTVGYAAAAPLAAKAAIATLATLL